MVLTTVDEKQAPDEARHLLSRAKQEATSSESRAMIEMILTIMSYRFEQLNSKEIKAMLNITLEETQMYKDILKEGRQKGQQEGRQEGSARFAIRLLKNRFGELPEAIMLSISELSLSQLDRLNDTILDFKTLTEVRTWIEHQRTDKAGDDSGSAQNAG